MKSKIKNSKKRISSEHMMNNTVYINVLYYILLLLYYIINVLYYVLYYIMVYALPQKKDFNNFKTFQAS